MSSDFLNLLGRLVRAGVDFVIVGGFAGVVHGCTYVTQDVDICCDFSRARYGGDLTARSDKAVEGFETRPVNNHPQPGQAGTKHARMKRWRLSETALGS